MGTSAQVNFLNGDDSIPTASLYFHFDGYPENMEPFLQDFFNEVEENVQDTRFGDASYLAAKLVVYAANIFTQYSYPASNPDKHRLDFLSLGIIPSSGYGTDYVYDVRCTNANRATVTYRRG